MSRLPKILIVDDEQDIVSTISEYLTGEDFDVYSYTDPQEALKEVCRVDPDVMLVDIMMPEIEGYEFCKQVKSHPRLKNVPVIFLTSRQLSENPHDFLKSGGFLFINKPLQLTKIRDLLNLITRSAATSRRI